MKIFSYSILLLLLCLGPAFYAIGQGIEDTPEFMTPEYFQTLDPDHRLNIIETLELAVENQGVVYLAGPYMGHGDGHEIAYTIVTWNPQKALLYAPQVRWRYPQYVLAQIQQNKN